METILLLSQTETSSHDADTLHLLFMCVHLYNNAYVQQSMFKNVQLGCDGRSIGAHLHDSLSLCHFHSIPI